MRQACRMVCNFKEAPADMLTCTATAAAAATATAAGAHQVTYREFAYGHMDFTSLAAFSIKDEMRYHVMRALNTNS